MAEDKIVYYKGKTLEELKKLSFEEFTALLPSELRRKIKRGFTEQEQKLLDKIKSHEKNIKTHCREMIVLPNMVGEKLGIYNGKEFVSIVLTDEMIGLRLGELAPTRKIGVKHSGAAAKKVEKRK
ncbi:ribosomal protein S19 family protein [Candidatus Woesearchaeota archaeon]|nr:ribosomal protein S19 family protein [Nanoarchaeota archaeon]MCB9370325.1 ribosomal protein S19 family protein [Candidatus Woesearchaeota archaeon]USN44847.1 MAG: ribosomal protein S19 family protein [Candidatus Woesearchaeota archaeon]